MSLPRQKRSIRFNRNDLKLENLVGGAGIIFMMVIAARMTELAQCFK